MITSIEYLNYKAFDQVKIPIKPITILLGANSVGKSSIIQSLLMLQQTGKEGLKSYKSALKLYGGYVNLGDPINLFRNKDTSKPVTINIEIRSKEIKEYLEEQALSSFIRTFGDIPLFLPFRGFSNIRDRSIESKKDFEEILDVLIEFLTKSSTKERYQNEVQYFLSYRYDFGIPELNRRNKKQILEIYSLLDSLRKSIKNEFFNIHFELKINKDKNLELMRFKVRHNTNNIIDFSNNGEIELCSDFIEFTSKQKEEFAENFESVNTIFNCFQFQTDDKSKFSVKTKIMSQIMHKIQSVIQNEFSENNINYVSPLRAHPKRYYMLDKAKLNLTLDTLDGDAITEVLKDNLSLTRKVNNWLKKFGLEVDVREFKEVIHHLVVKQNNLDLDITDVGFGVSQILPVIIQGFLSNKNSITIIEQPEIHLHPKIQADLADLFIEIIKMSANRRLIIETHSEYILKRLRRRISEEVIPAEKVAICLFSPQKEKNSAKVKVLEIEEKGFFEWPEEFYGGELLKDTTEFLINQK